MLMRYLMYSILCVTCSMWYKSVFVGFCICLYLHQQWLWYSTQLFRSIWHTMPFDVAHHVCRYATSCFWYDTSVARYGTPFFRCGMSCFWHGVFFWYGHHLRNSPAGVITLGQGDYNRAGYLPRGDNPGLEYLSRDGVITPTWGNYPGAIIPGRGKYAGVVALGYKLSRTRVIALGRANYPRTPGSSTKITLGWLSWAGVINPEVISGGNYPGLG